MEVGPSDQGSGIRLTHALVERTKEDSRAARTEAQSGCVEDCQAYILWEKKGKKVQSRIVPVVYGRAIECADSEQWDTG